VAFQHWTAEPRAPDGILGEWSITAQATHWNVLGPFDSKVDTSMAEIIRFTVDASVAEGIWYSHPYDCVNDLRGALGERCIDETTPGYDDNLRATPATTMSMIGHQVLGAESLSALNDGSASPTASSGGGGGGGGGGFLDTPYWRVERGDCVLKFVFGETPQDGFVSEQECNNRFRVDTEEDSGLQALTPLNLRTSIILVALVALAFLFPKELRKLVKKIK